MASLGSLIVSLIAETSNFISGMKRAEGAVRSAQDAIGSLSSSSEKAMGNVAGGLSDIGHSLAGIVSLGREADAIAAAFDLAAENAGRLATVAAAIPTGPIGVIAASANAILGAAKDAALLVEQTPAALQRAPVASESEQARADKILEDEKSLRRQLEAFADLSRVAGRSMADVGAGALERRLRAAGTAVGIVSAEVFEFRSQLESMENAFEPPVELSGRLTDNIGEGLPGAKAFAEFLERGIPAAARAIQEIADGMGEAARQGVEMHEQVDAMQRDALEADERRADVIKALSESPAARLERELAEISRLQQLDLFDLEESERARAKARERFDAANRQPPPAISRSVEPRGAQALLFGTSAALIASLGRGRQTQDFERRTAVAAEKTAKLIEQQNKNTGSVRVLAIK